ncbi:hypothetical protein HFP72_02080 [Nocardiopsis sp. ARC36]
MGRALVHPGRGSAAAAVLVAMRALGAEGAARRAAPFLVLLPAAVWAGVSADGYFAAVTAWGLALLAVGASPGARAPRSTALAAGLLLGWAVYLSYGLVLAAVPALAVLLCARNARPLPTPWREPWSSPPPSPRRASTGGRGTACSWSATTRGWRPSALHVLGVGQPRRRVPGRGTRDRRACAGHWRGARGAAACSGRRPGRPRRRSCSSPPDSGIAVATLSG